MNCQCVIAEVDEERLEETTSLIDKESGIDRTGVPGRDYQGETVAVPGRDSQGETEGLLYNIEKESGVARAGESTELLFNLIGLERKSQSDPQDGAPSQ